MAGFEINGNIKDSEMVDGIRVIKDFDLKSILLVENPINPECVIKNHDPSMVVGSFKGVKFKFEQPSESEIERVTKHLRNQEIEELCKTLEKYDDELGAM